MSKNSLSQDHYGNGTNGSNGGIEEISPDLHLQVEDDTWEPDLKLTRLPTEVEAGQDGKGNGDYRRGNSEKGGMFSSLGRRLSGEGRSEPERRLSSEGDLSPHGTGRRHIEEGSFRNRPKDLRTTSFADQLDNLIDETMEKVDHNTPNRVLGSPTTTSLRRRNKQTGNGSIDDEVAESEEGAHISAQLGVTQDRTSPAKSAGADEAVNTEGNAKARWAKAAWYATQQAAENARERGLRTVSSGDGLHRTSSVQVGGGSFRRIISSEGDEGRFVSVRRLLDSVPMHVLFALTTAYALFSHDIYFLSQPWPGGDYPLFTCTFAVAVLFTIELCVRAVVEKGYFNSYIFWLDLVAIISFVPDIAWWANKTDLIDQLGSLTIARAGRAARAGARAARIVRAMHYIRRFFHRNDDDDKDDDEESVHDFGKNLGSKISQLLIVVVAVMLILNATVSGILGVEPRVDWELKAVASAYVDGFGMQPNSTEFNSFVTSWVEQKKDSREPVLLLEVDGEVIWGSKAEVDSVRQFPLETYEAEIEDFRQVVKHCKLVVSRREEAEREYIGGIITGVVIIFLLATASCYYAGYLDTELVLPMERMMSSVEAFARDPLKPLKERSSIRHKETINLENALIKFGCLLQIAYGEAGAKVISASLHNDGSAQVGKVVNAFYGFCDIRNFTDLTEVLQAEVVKLVNDVAHVVHEAVCLNHGAPNKNIGDAFLLVWKPKKRETSASQTAESALRSYICIIIELTRNKELLKFATRREIQDRIPGFTVRLGFGLHFGWAIECAIGSQRKIDASYLSPHVNMASRLESATKMFGVAILISEATYQLFSSSVQKMCRLVDRVTFKGSVRPMSIYTYDVPYIEDSTNGGTLKEDVCLDDVDMTHEDFFVLAQPHTSEHYRHAFERAVHRYLGKGNGEGANWTEAKDMLRRSLDAWPQDGAARKLLDYLEEAGDAARPGEVPEGWSGFRKLDEK